MWRKVISGGGGALNQWRFTASRRLSTSVSSAVDSILLRSLKEHYLEVSKMTPPPKMSPPSPFSIVKGALDSSEPVLKRSYGDEEISIHVTRLATLLPDAANSGNDDGDEDGINQLFLHVNVSKPGQKNSLHFLCGLYPDALGIHSVSLRPKLQTEEFHAAATIYGGPTFEELDDKMRDAFHSYIEERGVNESLFPFLQAWLYVKDHRGLMRYFKTVGTFITENKQPHVA